MSRRSGGDDRTLYELAQSLSVVHQGQHPAVPALHKLAQAGFTTLEEVRRASDWELLALKGIGLRRLGAIRQLLGGEWRPPASADIRVGRQFLTVVRLALRWWPAEDLVCALGQEPLSIGGETPIEAQRIMELFLLTACEALRYSTAEELGQIVHRTKV